MEVRNETRHEVMLPPGYSGIELHLDCGEVDLHNFADYVGHEAQGETVRLRWHESKPKQLFIRVAVGKTWSKQIVREVVWVFENATVTAKSEHDPEMPKAEDETLAEYRVLSSDDDGCTIEFSFHGGVAFQIQGKRQYAIVS